MSLQLAARQRLPKSAPGGKGFVSSANWWPVGWMFHRREIAWGLGRRARHALNVESGAASVSVAAMTFPEQVLGRKRVKNSSADRQCRKAALHRPGLPAIARWSSARRVCQTVCPSSTSPRSVWARAGGGAKVRQSLKSARSVGGRPCRLRQLGRSCRSRYRSRFAVAAGAAGLPDQPATEAAARAAGNGRQPGRLSRSHWRGGRCRTAGRAGNGLAGVAGALDGACSAGRAAAVAAGVVDFTAGCARAAPRLARRFAAGVSGYDAPPLTP